MFTFKEFIFRLYILVLYIQNTIKSILYGTLTTLSVNTHHNEMRLIVIIVG
jgi:hypothetical protein